MSAALTFAGEASSSADSADARWESAGLFATKSWIVLRNERLGSRCSEASGSPDIGEMTAIPCRVLLSIHCVIEARS